MRTVIKNIQNQVGITTVYVTHDQEEAMAISDRIAVISAGVIQHVGTPKNLYQRPADRFVASFIGRANLVPARLEVEDDHCRLVFPDGYQVPMENIAPPYRQAMDVTVSIRPEEFIIQPDAAAEGIPATVNDGVFLGLNTHYFVTTDDGRDVEIIQESQIDSIIPKGARIRLTVKQEKINVFTNDSQVNIVAGVVNDAAGE
jgi:iron(III) transport system ATP-binding protein